MRSLIADLICSINQAHKSRCDSVTAPNTKVLIVAVKREVIRNRSTLIVLAKQWERIEDSQGWKSILQPVYDATKRFLLLVENRRFYKARIGVEEN
jgi:hypothetical protein